MNGYPPGKKVEFYASVHVGPDASFVADLPAFNGYLEKVSAVMKLGRTESRLAVYLPLEDNRRQGLIPEEERTPAAVYRWELRHVVVPRDLEGHAPLWISAPFLARAEMADGLMRVGDGAFPALLVDVEWLDLEALTEILRLARSGLRVALRRLPGPPGKRPPAQYSAVLEELRRCPTVVERFEDLELAPLIAGSDLPPFWVRRTPDSLYLFFAHPKARELRYPMRYGQSLCLEREVRSIAIDFENVRHELDLVFEPYQSLLVSVSSARGIRLLDIEYRPPEPVQSA